MDLTRLQYREAVSRCWYFVGVKRGRSTLFPIWLGAIIFASAKRLWGKLRKRANRSARNIALWRPVRSRILQQRDILDQLSSRCIRLSIVLTYTDKNEPVSHDDDVKIHTSSAQKREKDAILSETKRKRSSSVRLLIELPESPKRYRLDNDDDDDDHAPLITLHRVRWSETYNRRTIFSRPRVFSKLQMIRLRRSFKIGYKRWKDKKRSLRSAWSKVYWGCLTRWKRYR